MQLARKHKRPITHNESSAKRTQKLRFSSSGKLELSDVLAVKPGGSPNTALRDSLGLLPGILPFGILTSRFIQLYLSSLLQHATRNCDFPSVAADSCSLPCKGGVPWFPVSLSPLWPSGKTLGWLADDVGSIPRFDCPSCLNGLWTVLPV